MSDGFKVVLALFAFASPVLFMGGLLLWDMEKERRGYSHIARVMRRQRDEARAAGEPWRAGRAWPNNRDN